jgi:uncharacterized protein YyaL (SSP411 family)
LNLIRLAELFDEKKYREAATQIFQGSGTLLTKNSHALPLMLTALDWVQKSTTQVKTSCSTKQAGFQIIIADKTDSKECREMLKTVKSKLIPNRIVIYANADNKGKLPKHSFSSPKL